MGLRKVIVKLCRVSFFNYVDQILPIIDQWHPTYPRLTLEKKFIYCYKEKSA